MNYNKEDQQLLDIIASLFQSNTRIEVIQPQLIEIISLCSPAIYNDKIVAFVTSHAVNYYDIESSWITYSEILSTVFEYAMKSNGSPLDYTILYQTIDTLLDFLSVVSDGITKTRYNIILNQQSQQTMNSLMALLSRAIALMIRSYRLLTLDRQIEDLSFNLRILADYILDSDTISDSLAMSFSDLCKSLVEFDLLQLSDHLIEELIIRFLHLMVSYSKSESILNQFSDALTSILQKNLKLEFVMVFVVSDCASKVADLKLASVSVLTALLNLSCAILQNNGPITWLSNVQGTIEKLPLSVQEHPQLFAVTSRVHCFTTCIGDGDSDGVKRMDIDQESQISYIESQTPQKVVLKVDDYFNREIISELVTELVASNLDDENFLNQIEKIKITLLYTTTPSNIILDKYRKSLTEYGVGHITLNPTIIEAIASLFHVNIPQFLTHNIQFIIPYIVIDCENKNEIFSAVATTLDTKVRILCRQQIYPLLLRLLLEENEDKLGKALSYLRRSLFGQSVNELVQENETKLTIDLAMYLGLSGKEEQILHAFERLTEMVNKSATKLSDILSNSLFGITMAVSNFISQKRNHDININHPNAVEALKAVINEIGPEISRHTMHLMKLFDSIHDLEGMETDALDLWILLIHALRPNDILSHLNAFLRGLIQFLPVVDKLTRKKVAKEIESLLIEGKLVLTQERYLSLPIIPNFEELEKTRAIINNKTDASLDEFIKSILKRLEVPDDAEVQSALGRLDIILKYKENFVDILLNNINQASQLYSKLLSLARKYAHHKEIPYLAAVCLGKLGATDPSILPVSVNEDKIIIQSNFENKTENMEFVSDLIENHLIPAFNASTDQATHQYIQYTIQTLLVCAKFSPTKPNTMVPLHNVAYERWKKFPMAIQEFLSPLLSSSYDCEWDESTIDYPIYNTNENFSDWIQKWYSKLTREAFKDAQDIFKACIPVIRSGILDVAQYLLPCLVLHIVQLDDTEHVSHISEEMVIVLKAAINDITDIHDKKNLSCLKVIVSITHYCRIWMRFKGILTPEARAQVSVINQFLSKIPDKLMTLASMRARAYPQALMHFEKNLKEKDEPTGTDEAVKILRQIYGHLNDKDSMQVLFDMYPNVFTVEHEWLQYENEGRWDVAEISLREQIKKHPNRLSSYTTYLDCLQKAGEYEEIIHRSILPKNKIHWRPQINSYKISAAWKTENWTELDELVKSPIERKFEALLGSAICSLRKNDNIQAASNIQEARMTQIEALSASQIRSYRDVYPIIFNLQQLQDLEDSQYAWESKDEKQIGHLYKKWEKQFDNIIPSYKYQRDLLELRKAALFDMRLNSVYNTRQDFPYSSGLYWNLLAKHARKSGNMKKAYFAINKAEEVRGELSEYERAKWYIANGYTQSMVGFLLKQQNTVQSTLLLAKYTQSCNDVELRTTTHKLYRTAMSQCQTFEKIYYQCSNYYAGMPNDNMANEHKIKCLLRVLQFSQRGLSYGSKYHFSNVANMINSWFDLSKKLISMDKSNPLLKNLLEHRNKLGDKLLSQVPAYQYVFSLPRLVSHLTSSYKPDIEWLSKMIQRVFQTFPRSTIWMLLAANETKVQGIKTNIDEILRKTSEKYPSTVIPKVVHQARQFTSLLKQFAMYDTEKEFYLNLNQLKFRYLFELTDLDLYVPNERSLLPHLPEEILREAKIFSDDLPTIKGFGKEATVMKSLQKPKKFTLIGSDGKSYNFLAKLNDDLRKDARTMDFNIMINSFLKKNSKSRDRELYIRTYAVIPLGEQWGIIEWIDNLSSLKEIVGKRWDELGVGNAQKATTTFKYLTENKVPAEKTLIFVKRILPSCPPVLYKWFLQSFPDPNQWLASRSRFTKTLAVMSIVGYLLGLGDRHAENMSFDGKTGDVVHVDLNMIFDRGLSLSVPEIVPFRLTHNLTDAMGYTGVEGTFRKVCEITFDVLIKNKDPLFSVFQTLLNDPIMEWSSRHSHPDTAAQVLAKMREKYIITTSVEAKVTDLIKTATDNNKLAQMYVGWAPFI